MAHWVMQRDALALMIPSPDGRRGAGSSAVTLDDYARELDALVLMGGSDVCPGNLRRARAASRMERRPDPRRYEIALIKRIHRASQARARRLPRRADHQRRAWRHAVSGHRDAAPGRARAPQLGHLRRQLPSPPRSCRVSGLAALYPGAARSRKPIRCIIRRPRTSGAIWSSKRGPSPTAWSRRCAGSGLRTCSACSGIRSSILRPTRSFIDDTPILDDFLAPRQTQIANATGN